MAEPLAYFLTWTTYGTWLPGEERGWVDKSSAAPDAPIQVPDPERSETAHNLLKQPIVRLSEPLRRVVMRTVQEVCQYRGWQLHAVNCRSNHVHVIVTAPGITPELVMNQLKSWCSRRLNEFVGEHRREHWWTRHGSTLYVNSEEALADKIDYVLNRQ